MDDGDVTTTINKQISIRPKKFLTKQLKNYYDENGKNINKLEPFKPSTNIDKLWWYETPIAQKLPQM